MLGNRPIAAAAIAATASRDVDAVAALVVTPAFAAAGRKMRNSRAGFTITPAFSAKSSPVRGVRAGFTITPVVAGRVGANRRGSGGFAVSPAIAGAGKRWRNVGGGFQVIPVLAGYALANYVAQVEGDMAVSPFLRGRIAREGPAYGSFAVTVNFGNNGAYGGRFWQDDPAPVKPGWTANAEVEGFWVPIPKPDNGWTRNG